MRIQSHEFATYTDAGPDGPCIHCGASSAAVQTNSMKCIVRDVPEPQRVRPPSIVDQPWLIQDDLRRVANERQAAFLWNADHEDDASEPQIPTASCEDAAFITKRLIAIRGQRNGVCPRWAAPAFTLEDCWCCKSGPNGETLPCPPRPDAIPSYED